MPARPQQHDAARGEQVDDGRLDADRARAAVEDVVARRIELRAEIGDDVIGGRRADRAEPDSPTAPATPPPNAASSCCAIGCAGTRNPTVSAPPVVAVDTRAPRRTMIVSGPGHAARASARAAGEMSAPQSSIASAVARCTISGWPIGRALDREDARDRVGARGIGAEAIHGLRRKRDEPAGAQDGDRAIDIGAARGDRRGHRRHQRTGRERSAQLLAISISCAPALTVTDARPFSDSSMIHSISPGRNEWLSELWPSIDDFVPHAPYFAPP